MNKYLTQPNPTAHTRAGGKSAHDQHMSLVRGAIEDMARYSGRGEHALATQARRTLDDLCCAWQDDLGGIGYPPTVRAMLRAAGLRETAI